ncbi:AfsR/SARP family transcriptional regulator [Streptacidiphilus cavernicola]|uniref:BTAD domain-containing putative transcriptional regulator n=1 Tax=Streptacidiphilus cavernicola TaxID=3342716 RepID=A0ABV6VU07_9ACTN
MRIQLLGPLQVTDADGAPVDLGGTRLRVLLAALALDADRPVSASSLTTALWPDGDRPGNPANALQALVSRLRAALGRDLVAAAPTGYRLALTPDEVDVHRFTRLLRGPASGPPTREQLTEALALWRGPALADVPGFPEAAARLDALRANAREDLLDQRIAAGEGAELLGELHALCAEAPLRDRPRALLMRALHRAGRTAEALAVYEQGRELLADELGTDPSPILRAAHQSVLTTPPPPAAPGATGLRLTPPPSADSTTDPTPPSATRPGTADARPTPPTPAAPGPPDTPAPATHPGTATSATPGTAAAPAAVTSFLGREADLVAVRAALAAGRLVTLIGPGGAGKTRLALEAAGQAEGIQVRLVELAPLTDPADLPATVLAALQLRESAAAQRATIAPHPVAEATERIIEALGARPLLLVLDNCEHLIEAAAVLSARLLAGCRGLRILATSREALGISGEQLHPVPPLGFPEDPRLDRTLTPDQVLTPDQADGFPAVRLFADRAAAVRPGYRPTARDLPAVLRICRALDGQPLAIELAAARMRSLTPEQIDQRLARRFHLLTGGSRAALPRQRTLRAVVDWSWDLLEKPERALLARMSVFAGGAELETVEEVCTAEELPSDEVMDALASLVDKSLVVRTSSGRHRLLETIRVYAAEKLDDAGATAATRNAHAAHFLALAEEGEPRLYTFGQVAWLARFKAEHENLVSALRWSVEQRDAETAQRLVAAMGWYLWRRGERGENLPLVHQALELPADGVPLRTQAVARGITALYGLDTTWELTSTLELMRSAMALRDRLDDPDAHPLLPMLDIMSSMFEQKDWRIGVLAERLFDNRDPWVQAIARMFMGYALQNSGRVEESGAYLVEAGERFRVIGDLWGRSFCAAGLADYAQWRGDIPEAVRLWELAISYENELGISADSGDYRARLLVLRTMGPTIDAETLAELEQEAATALSEGTWTVVIATHSTLAEAYRRLGRLDDGRRALDTASGSVSNLPSGAPQIQALLLGARGYLEAADGRLERAAELHRQALEAALSAFDGPVAGNCLQGWADLALRQGDPARAAELLGAAHRLRGMADRSSTDVLLVTEAATEALGAEAFAAAYERGRATPSEQTVASLGVVPVRIPSHDDF